MTEVRVQGFAGLAARHLPCAVLVYIAAYLFVPYQPFGLGITPHTFVLGIGILMLISAFSVLTFDSNARRDVSLFTAFVAVFYFVAVFMHDASNVLLDVRRYSLGFLAWVVIYFGSQRVIHQMRPLILIFVASSSILIFLQIFISTDFYIARYLGDGISSVYGAGFHFQSNISGAFLSWALVILGDSVCIYWKRRPVIFLFSLTTFVMGVAALYFTLSLAAWLGFALGGLIMLATRAVRDRSWFPVALGVLAAAVFFTATNVPSRLDVYENLQVSDDALGLRQFALPSGGRNLSLVDEIQDYCRTFEPSGSEFSWNTRLLTVAIGKLILMAEPLRGVGISSFPAFYMRCHDVLSDAAKGRVDKRAAMTPHSSIIELTSDVGIIPSLLLAALILSVFVRVSVGGADGAGLVFAAGLISVIVWAAFHDALKDRLFWIAVALTAGAARMQCREQIESLPSK